MDGFHALGTQGRSHPRKRQDPAEAKVAKKLLRCRFLQGRGGCQAAAIRPIDPPSRTEATSFRVGDESKAKHPTHTNTHTHRSR